MAGYREDVTKAMKTSSLKGLPKIFTAPNVLHRILWTMAFLIFFGICIQTVYLNVTAYLKYPKVTSVEQKIVNRRDPNGTVPFPTVTLCDLNQFGSNSSVFEEFGIPLPADYYNRVHDLTECEGCTPEVEVFTGSIKQKLMTNRGYFQYVGKDAIWKIGDHHLVLLCQALVDIGSGFVSYPCQNVTTSYRFFHPHFGICRAYELLSQDITVVGYTFTLHLDSLKDNVNTEFEPLLFPQPHSGVIITALDPYGVPAMHDGVALAGPGQATTHCVKITRTDRLSIPYSYRECIDTEEHGQFQFQGRVYNYDYETCIGRCSMALVEEMCNCSDLFLLRSPDDGIQRSKYCGSISQPPYELYNNMYCAELARETVSEKCEQRCKVPCKSIKYDLSTTASKWPLPSQVGSFYKKMIQNDPILFEKYREYEGVAKAMAAGAQNVSDLERLLVSRAIEDNFALVSIYLKDHYYTHYESEPKTSPDAFLSQLGGSLNLWSGITVVFMVEVIDLFLRILARMTGTEVPEAAEKGTAITENKTEQVKMAGIDQSQCKMDTVNA